MGGDLIKQDRPVHESCTLEQNIFNRLPFICFRAAKEVKKTQKAAKKPAAAATKAKPTKPAQKATKSVQKAAPRVGGKR